MADVLDFNTSMIKQWFNWTNFTQSSAGCPSGTEINNLKGMVLLWVLEKKTLYKRAFYLTMQYWSNKNRYSYLIDFIRSKSAIAINSLNDKAKTSICYN